jgi:hypothetical protein
MSAVQRPGGSAPRQHFGTLCSVSTQTTRVIVDLDRAERAALEDPVRDRVSFQLTYAQAPRKRDIAVGGIDGPSIPDAYNPSKTSPGDWEDADGILLPASRETVLAHFFQMALNEAMHEALEWFQFDGKPLLDPHGPSEAQIYELANKVGSDLFALVDTTTLNLD